MRKAALFSLLTDTKVLADLKDQRGGWESGFSEEERIQFDLLIKGNESAVDIGALRQPEAIILTQGRPALLIKNGMWEQSKIPELKKRIDAAAAWLGPVIPRVGRVEIIDYTLDYVGTGWMIEEDVMVTNRHVGELFARRQGNAFTFRTGSEGKALKTRVDFLREHENSTQLQASVLEVLFLEESGGGRPDMALVRLDRTSAKLPEPIELDNSVLEFHDDIAVIGYPAEDPRNDTFVMREIFRDIYGVKRLSPGWLSGVRPDGMLLHHDSSTLGGNSGSVVIKLATGKACGLHFAGTYLDNNYAVTSAAIKQRLAQIGRTIVAVPVTGSTIVEMEEAPSLAGRKGYDPDFLGFSVPLPEIPEALLGQVAAVKGSPDGELKYGHFSVKMRADRRVAFFTAVNIDGEQLFSFPRAKDKWFKDPRLVDAGHQTDDQLYDKNQLDRGHLVRRLDPGWGETRKEGAQAVDDTFFFTNCSPQHARLNQKTWLSLEDYVLKNAATHNLKVSVFTGPCFRDEDRIYRKVGIPEEFWKVVVIVNEFTRRLSATGYLLSQADYLGDLEFVFGEFRSYQVPVAELEKKTGLSFGKLEQYDPLRSVEANPHREIRGPDDLVL